MKNLLKKTFLLLALVGGVSSSWADVTPVEIPQNMGIYIPISTDGGSTFCSYIVGTNINRQNNLADGSTYYTIGCEKNQNVVINIHAKATVAGDYVFGFKTGADNSAASTLNITITKSGKSPVTVATDEAVTTNGNWNPTVEHKFYLSGLEENGEYTVSITATKTSGSYCGNFGLFYFHTVSQYPAWPTDGTTTIDLSGGTYYKSQYNNDGVISELDNGGYMDNILLYNSTEGYYTLKFNVQDYKADGTLTATIYNMATGEAEITTEAIAITSTGDKTIRLGKSLTTGLKRLRFDFTGTKTNGTIFNYKNVTFQLNSYDALPIIGTAVLDLSKGSMTSSSDPRYSSAGGTNNEISYIYNGGYADDFYVVIGGNETAYYDLRTTTSNYNKGGTFKVTITDMDTNTIEVNSQESATITSNGQSIIMPLTTALKPGLKKIRFDFIKDGESAWLYNLKDICFDPVSVSVTVTTAGYATYVSAYDLDFSETSIKAYTATVNTSTGVVTLNPINKVPAGTPVVLYKDGGATEDIPFAESTDEVGDNDLVAGTGGAVATGTGPYNYILNNVSGIGFYKANGKTVATDRAYLQTTYNVAESGARGMTLEFAEDILTGINEAEAATEAIAKEGKFIVDGKLVIFKKGMKFNANGQMIK